MFLLRTIGILMALAMKIQYSVLNLTQTNSILLILFWTKLILGWLNGDEEIHLFQPQGSPSICLLMFFLQVQSKGLVQSYILCVFGESVLVQSITQYAWGLRTHLGDHDSCIIFHSIQIQPSSLFYIILTHKHLVYFSCLACLSGPMVNCFDISIFLLISNTGLPYCHFLYY